MAVAGFDQTLCNESSTTLEGNAPIVGTGNWTVESGTAIVTTPGFSPTSTITGLNAGVPEALRWTISNSPCTSTFDEVLITVSGTPTTAEAGPDQNLCNVTTTALAGNAPDIGHGTGTWSVVSGAATIAEADIHSPAAPVTGLSVGASVTLQWTISNPPCAESTDIVVINVSAPPTTAEAGSDLTGASTCGLTTVTMAANAPGTGSGLWSIGSGTGGSFADPSSPTSNFSGTAGSTYTLLWTITNGNCTSTDDVVVTFNQIPSVNAGPDLTGASTCGLTTVALAANDPVPDQDCGV